MPLILQQKIAPGTVLGLWKTEETAAELLALCTPDEQRQSATFAHEHRRREWLAWHALLQTLHPGARAGYDEQGGPVLQGVPPPSLRKGNPAWEETPLPEGKLRWEKTPLPEGKPLWEESLCIGVSHTADYAAVILSPRPCAVDIESTRRNYTRVLRRYASPEEQRLGEALPDPALYPALFWCAKETLYKLKRRPGVDFLRDMRIEAVDPEARTLEARFGHERLRLQYLIEGSLCCVFGLE